MLKINNIYFLGDAVNTSYPINNVLLYILIGFLTVFWISYTIFFILFVLHVRALAVEYKLKTNYNKLKLIIEFNKFKFFHILAKNDVEFDELYAKIKKIKTLMEEKINNEIKNKLINLTIVNSNFAFRDGKIISTEIKNNLADVEKTLNNLKKIEVITLNDSHIMSKKLLEYRIIIGEILIFYENNLSLKYKQKIFKNYAKLILFDLDKTKLAYMENKTKSFLTNSLHLNNNLQTLYYFIEEYYVLDKFVNLCNFSLTKIREEIETNIKTYSPLEQNEILECEVDTKRLLAEAAEYIDTIEIKNAWEKLKISIRNIEKINTIIKLNGSTNLCIKNNIKWISEQISKIESKKTDIETYFNKLKSDFANNKLLVEKINVLFLLFKQLKSKYLAIENNYNNFNNFNRKNIFFDIQEVVALMLKFKKEMYFIFDEIKLKYNNFIWVIDNVCELKMTLIQLNNCNSSPNTSQNTINSNIKNLLMIIEDIELKIKTDYEKNYLYAKEEINNILQQVPQLIDSYSLNNTLKYFLKRLLFFSNKFRNENDEIKKIIKNCETLYMQNKYTEGIDKLLVMLNNIKLSAHNNNINNI
ncbi:MAG: hypothetical protein LBH55_03170 [Mycoplasmataceae bacterium]|nr:hypothetical protein [Mycoplasmataceae bacterium]